MSDILQRIRTLQFNDRSRAEALLLSFIRDTFPLNVTQVELRPLAVSLNSFNGFMTLADGKRLFFKTHTEPDTVISEYYHAANLAKAGYPVIQPLFGSTEVGKQFLIYEIVELPSVFDIAWAVETDKSHLLPILSQAQHEADDHLRQIYLATLQDQTIEQAAKALVHQLFYHRLTGGRLNRFYGQTGEEVQVALPEFGTTMHEVRRVKWQINGQHYADTLNDLIERSTKRLYPAQAGPSIVGHGDAHNGNVFFDPEAVSLCYFDPAFAGQHHPLLDLTKPLFHNVFAMWMYFPTENRLRTNITLQRTSDTWRVEHDYAIPPIRLMFLRSKVERVLVPILQELKRRNQLDNHWQDYLKAALFCCPFLTMNLADAAKFPPEIALLGFAMAVEMGAPSHGERSLIDATLDEVEAALA